MWNGGAMVRPQTFYANPDMRKALFQFSLLVILFFGTWFLLNKINLVDLFKVKEATASTEEKLGNAFYDLISNTEVEIDNPAVISPLNTYKSIICKNNDIDPESITLHLIDKDEVNAFALPNRHLVVYSGLIKDCDNADELCGVLGHEIAHIEHDHVMKKLLKEMGLSVLISITAGKSGSQILAKALKLLSSTAYDRTLESEADFTSADYAIKASIDPEQFANFLYKISTEEKTDMPEFFNLVNTHPDSEERAKAILDYVKTKRVIVKSVLKKEDWEMLKKKVSSD